MRTEEEREAALALRTKVLRAIGGLARGPGAERYQNIGSHADPNLASEESALLGTPEEIVARLKKLEAGGVDYVLLVDPTGSEGRVARVRRGDRAPLPGQARSPDGVSSLPPYSTFIPSARTTSPHFLISART